MCIKVGKCLKIGKIMLWWWTTENSNDLKLKTKFISCPFSMASQVHCSNATCLLQFLLTWGWLSCSRDQEYGQVSSSPKSFTYYRTIIQPRLISLKVGIIILPTMGQRIATNSVYSNYFIKYVNTRGTNKTCQQMTFVAI